MIFFSFIFLNALKTGFRLSSTIQFADRKNNKKIIAKCKNIDFVYSYGSVSAFERIFYCFVHKAPIKI